ncbi:MAG: conjugal transfer protein TraC, partial [Patescibacteria group bacterium]
MVETPNVYAPTAPAPAAGSPATLSDLAQTIAAGAVSVQDIIAPPSIDVDFNHLKIGETFVRTLFVSGYPRFVGANWLSPLINFNHTLTLSMFYYPVESKGVLDDLRRKIAEMEATIKENEKSGRVADPTVEAAVEDARSLQEQLVKGTERFFQFSFYITISADSMEELDAVTKKVESTLGSLLLLSKHATLRMEEAFQSTIPTCLDKLKIMRNMDTTSIATTFPLTSSELTANEGILYGINEHNGSLIIFDRFSLENANTVVFAKSGAGKSYAVKLEILRS